MLPDAFRVAPTLNGADQLTVIGHLLARRDATRIIIATDAGREGELIAWWILRHLGATQPVERLWLSENTPDALRDALAHLKPAHAYDGLAAAARSQADCLVGLNATRALSLRHGTGTLSVGRVQTPTLALTAHRDQRIADFRPEAFARVRVTCALSEGETAGPVTYPAIWRPQDPSDSDHPDRVSKDAAEALAARIPPGTPGQVATVDKQTVTLQPPLLYSLSDLQREANQRLSLSAQETLDAAQWLYGHRCTSYPRTSARHVTAAGAHQSFVLGLFALLAVTRIVDGRPLCHHPDGGAPARRRHRPAAPGIRFDRIAILARGGEPAWRRSSWEQRRWVPSTLTLLRTRVFGPVLTSGPPARPEEGGGQFPRGHPASGENTNKPQISANATRVVFGATVRRHDQRPACRPPEPRLSGTARRTRCCLAGSRRNRRSNADWSTSTTTPCGI